MRSIALPGGMAVINDGSETVRIDRLVMEMPEEVNKMRDLLINPPKNGRIPKQ